MKKYHKRHRTVPCLFVLSVLNSENKGDVFTYFHYDTDGDGVYDSSDAATECYEDGSSYSYTYDSNRNVISETSTIDGTTKTCYYTYDSMNNVLTETDSDGNSNTYEYFYYDTNGDSVNDRSEIKKETLEDGTVNNYTYHSNYSLHTLSSVKNGKTITYTYDEKGNQTSVNRNGFAYNYAYDNFGNTTSVKVGDQSLVSYAYSDDKTKLKTLTYGNGSGAETYTYNSFGSVTKKAVSGLGTYTFRYDSLNRLIYERDNVSGQKTYYLYDDEGRLYGERVNSTANSNAYANELYSHIRTLDGEGRTVNEKTTANGASFNLPFTYDEEGRMSTAAMTDIRILNYTYDEDGQLSTRTLSTGTPIAETFTYNDDGLVASHRVDDATRDNTYSYTYDEKGNITQIRQDGSIIHSYVYDSDSQLIRENNSVSGKTVTFTYDGYGNILQKNEYAFTVGDLGAVTDTVNYTYDGTWKDKLISYDGQSITYDAIGNPTNYMGATMTWNGRKLMSYTKGDLTVTYKYDKDGLRTQKTVNGVQHDYYYVDGKMVYENYGDGFDYFYRYDQDGRLGLIIKRRISDNYKWYIYTETNSRGDIVSLCDGTGTIVAKYNYDAWGKLISITNASGTPLVEGSFAHVISVRYRGYYYDSETGLYYLQSRYYDPETGRFLNADDVDFIGVNSTNIGYNAFAYCENEPLSNKDEMGYAIEILIDVASIGWSIYELFRAPTWVNVGNLIWDIAAAFIPFAPGSYVKKAGKVYVKIANKADDFKDIKALTLGTYKGLKKVFKKIKNIEVHHIIEKRFKQNFDVKPDYFLSVPITEDLHKIITKRWRNVCKYGTNYGSVGKKQMKNYIRAVYYDMPKLRNQALKWLDQHWIGGP